MFKVLLVVQKDKNGMPAVCRDCRKMDGTVPNDLIIMAGTRIIKRANRKYKNENTPHGCVAAPKAVVSWPRMSLTIENISLIRTHTHTAFGVDGCIWGGCAVLSGHSAYLFVSLKVK